MVGKPGPKGEDPCIGNWTYESRGNGRYRWRFRLKPQYRNKAKEEIPGLIQQFANKAKVELCRPRQQFRVKPKGDLPSHSAVFVARECTESTGDMRRTSVGQGPAYDGPPQPKRPLNAYWLFFAEKRAEIEKGTRTRKGSLVNKFASELWKELPDEGREPFEKQAAERLAAYRKELDEFKAAGGVATRSRKKDQAHSSFALRFGASRAKTSPIRDAQLPASTSLIREDVEDADANAPYRPAPRFCRLPPANGGRRPPPAVRLTLRESHGGGFASPRFGRLDARPHLERARTTVPITEPLSRSLQMTARQKQQLAQASGRKVKRVRHPDEPKRPVGGPYCFFLKERREEIRKEVPAGASAAALMKLMAWHWKSVSGSELERYRELYRVASEKYQRELKEFRLRHPDVVPAGCSRGGQASHPDVAPAVSRGHASDVRAASRPVLSIKREQAVAFRDQQQPLPRGAPPLQAPFVKTEPLSAQGSSHGYAARPPSVVWRGNASKREEFVKREHLQDDSASFEEGEEEEVVIEEEEIEEEEEYSDALLEDYDPEDDV